MKIQLKNKKDYIKNLEIKLIELKLNTILKLNHQNSKCSIQIIYIIKI